METNELVKVFIENNDVPWEQVDTHVKRKIMAYDRHHHSQITHVESGVFEVEIAGQKKLLGAGDAFYIPPNVLHGAVCKEAGVLIDVFSPMREDFIGSPND
jgi:quercetin dioxygenase-like cupin family protein